MDCHCLLLLLLAQYTLKFFFFRTPRSLHLATFSLSLSPHICSYILLVSYDLSLSPQSLYTSSLSLISHLIDTVAMKCREGRESNRAQDVVLSDFVACHGHGFTAPLRYRRAVFCREDDRRISVLHACIR